MYDACPLIQVDVDPPVLDDDVVRPAPCTTPSIVVGVGTLNTADSPLTSKRKLDATAESYAARFPLPLETVLPAANQPLNPLSNAAPFGEVVVKRSSSTKGGAGGGDGGAGGGGDGGGGGGDAGGGEDGGRSGGEGGEAGGPPAQDEIDTDPSPVLCFATMLQP